MKSIGPIHHLLGIIRTPDFLNLNVTGFPCLQWNIIEHWLKKASQSDGARDIFHIGLQATLSNLCLSCKQKLMLSKNGVMILTLCITECGQACRRLRLRSLRGVLINIAHVDVCDDRS